MCNQVRTVHRGRDYDAAEKRECDNCMRTKYEGWLELDPLDDMNMRMVCRSCYGKAIEQIMEEYEHDLELGR